jgi:uncharacterized membrane protein
MKNSKGFLNILSVMVIGISIFVVLVISLFLLFNFLIDLTAGNILGTITTTIIILLIGTRSNTRITTISVRNTIIPHLFHGNSIIDYLLVTL